MYLFSTSHILTYASEGESTEAGVSGTQADKTCGPRKLRSGLCSKQKNHFLEKSA